MTVQIEEGKFYKTNEGSVLGPAQPSAFANRRTFPWRVGPWTYTETGDFYADGSGSVYDLIEEVPNPATEDDGFITRDTPDWAAQVEAEAAEERDYSSDVTAEGVAEMRRRAAPFLPDDLSPIRTFSTGASRDQDASKFDFEGFLSPLALNAFAAYMHKNRTMADGSLRDSDNWQKGIPTDAYMKSMWRHFFDVWAHHRGAPITKETMNEALCGLLFNAMGYLHETQKNAVAD